MNAQEVLKDVDLSALQADHEKTLCLVITLPPSEDLFVIPDTDSIEAALRSCLSPKWQDVPVFVVLHGTKVEAVMADPVKLKEQQDESVRKALQAPVLDFNPALPGVVEEIGWTCSHAPGKFYSPEGRQAAQNIIDIFKKRLELTRLWLIGEGSGRPWHLRVTQMDNGWSIGLRTCGVMCPTPSDFGNTHFNVNIIGDTFYLQSIELVKHLRGRGYGSEMYETLEQIARDLNCKQIRQTPSGYVYARHVDVNPEPRRSWLSRRGWKGDGAEVYKTLREDK